MGLLLGMVLWATTAAALVGVVGIGAPRWWALVAIVVVGVLALGRRALAAASARLPGAASRSPEAWAGIARSAPRLLLGALVLASAVVTWRVLPLTSDPLTSVAGGRAIVTADVVVTSDPQSRSGRTSGSRRTDDGWLLDGVVTLWQGAGAPVIATDLPVRVLSESDVAAVLPGSVLRVRARVLSADPLRGRAVTLATESVTVVSGPPVVQGVAGMIRSALRAAVHDRPPDQAGLLPGLVVGDTSEVSPELDAAMRDSGLAHLTAVSGGNVAVVVLVVLGGARFCGLRRGRAQLLVVALGVAAYVVLARPQPSVVRAAAMTAVVLLAVLLDARIRPLDALGWSAGALVLLDPFLSCSIGFAMSVVATGALLLLARRWIRVPPGSAPRARLRHAVVGVVAVSAAAQVAVAPLVVGIGGGVPVGGVVANLLAAPAVPPATALGLVAALVGSLAAPLGALVAAPACWAVGWIALVARTSAAELGVVPWPSGWAGALGLALVLVLAAGAVLVSRRVGGPVARAALALLATGGVLALVPATTVPHGSAWPPPGWRAVMCDVGQGDAVVLNAGAGAVVVVDTGPDPSAVDRCLTRLGAAEVPVLVLTHFHADHVEGLPGVLGARAVGTVVVSPLPEPVGEQARVRRWLDAAAVSMRVAGAGDRWTVGVVTLRVVWPTRLIRGEGSDPNNASITLLAEVDGVSFLLGGDLEPVAQDAVIASGALARVDVVKVPHHGSARQSPGWVTTAGPSIALIGVGVDNDYGHPSPATLSAYRAQGVLVGRTDVDGDLAVLRDDDGALGLVRRGR